MIQITADQLKELLSYDRETGVFRWKTQRKGIRVGDVAGNVNAKGYRRIMIGRRLYPAHQLAWLYVHGNWPASELDHINGSKDYNGIANLREVTSSENQQNIIVARANSKTGLRGVCPDRNRFRAGIRSKGEKLHLGVFDTAEEAHAAYVAAKRRLHPGWIDQREVK